MNKWGKTITNGIVNNLYFPNNFYCPNVEEYDYHQINSLFLPDHNSTTRFYLLVSDRVFAPPSKRYGIRLFTINKENDTDYRVESFNRIFPLGNFITACKKEQNGYWIVFRDIDTLVSLALVNGLITDTVKSYAPERIRPYLNNELISNTLVHKFSGDSKLFLSLSYQINYATQRRLDTCELYAYSFDVDSGFFRNQKKIFSIKTDTIISSYFSKNVPYDLEFSPNDSFFYVLKSRSCYSITQYNRYNYTSKSVIHLSDIPECLSTLGLRLMPNRKIVFTYSKINCSVLGYGVISYPDRIAENCGVYLDYIPDKFNNMGNSNKARISFNLHDGFVHFSAEVNCKQVVFRNISDSIFSSYQWYFGDGDSLLSNNAVVSHTYSQPGKYLVKLKGIRPSGYVQWYSDSIEIGPEVTAAFTTNTTQACRYTAVQFMDSSVTAYVHPQNGARYYWNFGDGKTDTVQNPKHSYTQTGLFTISLIYSNGYCTDTVVQNAYITVIDAAQPGFNLPAQAWCAPASLPLQLRHPNAFIDSIAYRTSTGMDTSFAYSGSNTFTLVVNDTGLLNIQQRLRSKNGCITTDSLTIRINPGFSLTTAPQMYAVNVVGADSILLQWKHITGAQNYILYRNNATIATLPDTVFLDRIKATDAIYGYTLQATDVCQQRSSSSPVSSNLLLRAVPDEQGRVQLSWNPYVFWNSGVENYSVHYQRPDSFVELTRTSSLAFEDPSLYNDTLIDIAKCYRVTAHQNNSTASAKSNLVCIPFVPQLWIPDAFSPNPEKDVLNNCWSIEHVGVEEFYLELYNRWGERILRTTDKNFCWDGTYQNNPTPVGVYFYIVRAKGKAQLAFEKKGMLYLMR